MNRGRQWLLASVALAGAALSASAHAQQESAAQGQTAENLAVSEVVVTAQKRTEKLQEVPVSVTALAGAELEQMRALQIQDWAGYVPGLAIGNAGAPGETFLALDGIGPISAASQVGMYVDDVPVGSSSSFQGANGFSLDLMPYDLDRVEVLKGPQGTLYGASTMGGLIKYVLASPDLNTFSGHVGGDIFGVQNGPGPGGGFRGEINAPIVEDKLAIRASGYYERTPGYIDNATTGENGDNALKQAGGRVALLWKPTTDVSVQLGAIYEYDHSNNQNFVSLNAATGQPSFGPLDNINTLPEPFTQEVQLYNATVNWNLHWAQLTSVTSYQTFTNNTTEDLTDYIGKYLGFFGGPGPGLSDFHENYRLKKFTQEVRLSSPENQKFEWLIGGFYTHEAGSNYEVFNAYDLNQAPLAGLNPLEFVRLPSTYQEFAFFGDATYHFTDWFDLSAGVRYAHNYQTFTEYEGGVLVDPAAPTTPALAVPGSSNEGVTTFSVAPRLHLSKSTIAYARIASGYQPGGPNVVLPGVMGIPSTFGSSRLIDYQVGVKSTFLDGKASLDLSAFYIDWSKIQVSVLIGNQSAVENAGSAKSEGFDAQGTWSPLPGLNLGATLAYADATLTSAVPSIGAAVGARLPYVPMWEGSLKADYSKPINTQWSGFISGGWTYTGSRYSAVEGSISNGETQGLEVKSYGVVDLRVGARTHDLTLAVFAKNLGNDRAYLAPSLYFYDALTLPIDIKAPVLQPRTIGVSIDKSF